jgi:NADH-quinone oxidoreductase subunit E
MPWIVKPSATQQIDRRDQPYLTDALKRQLAERYLPRFPDKRAATLPALHLVQHTHNWIPFQAIEEIAAFLELSAAEVWDTATFYEEFFLEPKGRYLVQVCQSISCELCGQVDLQQKLQRKLDIVPGETTEDEKFTLQVVECLGACDLAPVVMINGKLYASVTWEQLEATLDALPDDPKAFDEH